MAHLKAITIPKMELSGAKEGTKLFKMVAKDLNIPATHLCSWTDSQVVLGWLNKSNHRWKQFVSARVQFIIDILPLCSGAMSHPGKIQQITSAGAYFLVRSYSADSGGTGCPDYASSVTFTQTR